MPLRRRSSRLRPLLLGARRRTVFRTIGTIFRHGNFALPTELNPGFALVSELTVLLLVAAMGKVLLEGILMASSSASVWCFWHFYETYSYCLDQSDVRLDLIFESFLLFIASRRRLPCALARKVSRSPLGYLGARVRRTRQN